MKIEIVEVRVENKGKYRMANVNYKTVGGPNDGKVDGKKIASFAFKDVFKALSEAQTGDQFDVQSEKNDKGYWDWKVVTPSGKNTAPTSSTYSATVKKGGDWETAEERAKKQVYIVRQSSITAAIELAKLNGSTGPITESDVIESAKKFESFVFGIEAVVESRVE